MSSSQDLAQLIEEYQALVEAKDFEGAEAVLSVGLEQTPQYEAFLHFQFGLLYSAWNKLTSAINHLNRAIEILDPEMDATLWIQVTGELKSARRHQADQQP